MQRRQQSWEGKLVRIIRITTTTLRMEKKEEGKGKGGTCLFVALLLPFRNQVGVCIAVLQEPVVEGLADGFFLVVEVVDVF